MNMKLTLIAGEGEKNVSPVCFDGVIGQTSVIKQMKFYIEAHRHGIPIPTLLFTGSHGLGKTYIAEKVAKNIGRRFLVVNSKSVSQVQDFIENIVLSEIIGDEPITVLFDESHGLSKEITTLLLTLINPKESNKNVIEYKGVGIEFDMSKINIIFATTDAHEMFNPLKSRCETVYFESYTDIEMIDILKYYIKPIEFNCDLDDVSQACRNRARDGYLLAKNIERYAKINGLSVIDNNAWNSIKEIFGIRSMGLNKTELSLLEYVKNHQPVSCSNMALAFMVNEENVKNEIEVRLRELDLISNTTRGRILTGKGEEYLESVKC